MGEISTSGCSEVEKIKQMLMDELKIHQRMIRSTAVEYQTLLKMTAVKLTKDLETVYKEKLLFLDEVASKIAAGDDVGRILSSEFLSSFHVTHDSNNALLKNAIESWSVSSSISCADMYVPISTPSFATETEVRVDVGSGITKQGVFWLYLHDLPDANQLALADLYKRISLEMLRDKDWKSFEELKTSPNVGDYVLVDARNGWARGKIEKLKDNCTFAVRLVDYGDLISCGSNLLLPMKCDLYPDTGYQALRCCLSLDGDPLDLPIEAVWVFNDLLREHFIAKDPVVCVFESIILGKDNEEIWQVDLTVKDKKGNSVSINEAVNKKIEDKARGRDSIACRDIRYSSKECTGSRYIERPAVSNSSQNLTATVIEKSGEIAEPCPSKEQRDVTSSRKGLLELMQGEQPAGEEQIAKPCPEQQDVMSSEKGLLELMQREQPAGEEQIAEPCPSEEQQDVMSSGKGLLELMQKEQPAGEEQIAEPCPSEEQQDVMSSGKGLLELIQGEQPAGEEQQSLLPDTSAPARYGSTCVAASNSVADSSDQVFLPFQSAVSEKEPEQHGLFNEESALPSTIPYAVTLDIQNLPCSEPSYAPRIVSSETFAATVDKRSTLKPDAAPFVSHSRTSLNSLVKPNPLPADRPVLYQPENYVDCVLQEQSVVEMHRYFETPMSLQVPFPNYAEGGHLEFGRNVHSVMPRMIYRNEGPAYSYMSPMFNPSCVPTYSVHDEVAQNSYSLQEVFASGAQATEAKFEEPQKVDHLLPAVCSAKGSEFSVLVTSPIEASGTFWVQLARNDQKEADAWNRLQTTLSTCNKLTLPIASEEVVPGLMAIVTSSQSGELYRAEVLSTKDRKAARCRLCSPSSDGGQYFDQTARKLFDSLVKGGVVTVTVMSVEYGNPDTLVVNMHDSTGRNVLDEMMRGHFSSQVRLSSRDDSGLSLVQQSPGSFAAFESLSDTAALALTAPVFPLNPSQQSNDCCEPVKKLMASVHRGPASLADAANASLALSSLAYDPRFPPPSLLPPSVFSQMGDASNRMLLAPNFAPSSDAQTEWYNQQTKVENQTGADMETSTETPRNRSAQSRRSPWQQRCGDDEQRSTPPLNVWNDGNESYQQSAAEADKAKPDKKNACCFNCGEIGHKRVCCPLPPQSHSKKTQAHGAYGRTNSRK